MPSGQPLRRSLTPRLTALALGVGMLAACARPVEVPAPEPAPAPDVAAACAQFIAALPQELSTVGQRRDVTPESDLTAAYGDPAVGVRCGVPTPTSIAPTSTLVTVDDVDWFPEELTAGWRMTSVGRLATVEITVPDGQGPAPSVAADLGPAVRAALPPTRPGQSP